MRIGDTVNLVRKISHEILPMTLAEVLIRSKGPAVEVFWKSPRHRYKLDLVKNEVLAIDTRPDHRLAMRRWYTVEEGHLKVLIELFWDERRKGKR